jgi:hypothetical protein
MTNVTIGDLKAIFNRRRAGRRRSGMIEGERKEGARNSRPNHNDMQPAAGDEAGSAERR